MFEKDQYNFAIIKIIEEQKLIVGPLAYDLAKRAKGVTFKSDQEVSVIGDPKLALEDVVLQFATLFGRASIEASKDALKRAHMTLLPENYLKFLDNISAKYNAKLAV